MLRLAFLVSVLGLALGFASGARATTEMSFVDAKVEFANLHGTFQSDVKTLELARDAELKRLSELLIQLNKDLKACPTYTCVKETKAAIAQAEQDKQVAVRCRVNGFRYLARQTWHIQNILITNCLPFDLPHVVP